MNPFPSLIFWHGAQVTIGEVQGQGVRIASRCLWDVETGSFDCKIALEYKNHCTTWRSMRSRASMSRYASRADAFGMSKQILSSAKEPWEIDLIPQNTG